MLRVTSDLNNLNEIREYVEKESLALGLDPEDVYGVILSVDEAVTNICVHGYQSPTGSVEVTVGREDHMLVINIRDQAPVFDPTTVAPPDLSIPLDERPLGGLGLHLIRGYMDEIIHHAMDNQGNELILKKDLRGEKK